MKMLESKQKHAVLAEKRRKSKQTKNEVWSKNHRRYGRVRLDELQACAAPCKLRWYVVPLVPEQSRCLAEGKCVPKSELTGAPKNAATEMPVAGQWACDLCDI